MDNNISNKPRIFVDMDGVLAVFNNQISSEEELLEKGYFRNLAPQQNVVDAVNLLLADKDVEVRVLSAYLPESDHAEREKVEWCKEHLPNLPLERIYLVECGTPKCDILLHDVTNSGKAYSQEDLFVKETDFLLDDYTKNLLEWPGKGVKLLNGINDTRGTWEGPRISSSLSPEQFIRELKEVMGVKHKTKKRIHNREGR